MRCLKKRSLSGRCELVYGYSRSNVHTHYCRHCLHHSSCFNLPNLRHTALKAAWMVVASNLSTGPDRASPELLTSCKHHDLLSSALLWPTLCSAINCVQPVNSKISLCFTSCYWNHKPTLFFVIICFFKRFLKLRTRTKRITKSMCNDFCSVFNF